jgi:hypothetical protein
MDNSEKVKKPKGNIGMILHKGGEYNEETGKIEEGKVIAKREVDNLIVDKASELMACRLAPGSATGSIDNGANSGTFLPDGLQYLSVGVGILNDPQRLYDSVENPVDTSQWDFQNPPEETLDTIKLQGEIFRKEFTSWSFVDVDGVESNTPTNILKLVTTFYEDEAVGPLTEMGLFGGEADAWNNGAGQDTGYMFNYKTFPVWNKPADARLTITWKLTF